MPSAVALWQAWAAEHPDDLDALALAAEAWANNQPWCASPAWARMG